MYNILSFDLKLLNVFCLYTEHFNKPRSQFIGCGLCTKWFNLYLLWCLCYYNLCRCKFVDCGSSVIISTSLRLGILDLTRGKHKPKKNNSRTMKLYFINRDIFSADVIKPSYIFFSIRSIVLQSAHLVRFRSTAVAHQRQQGSRLRSHLHKGVIWQPNSTNYYLSQHLAPSVAPLS